MDKLTVRAFMSVSPFTVGVDQPLRTAHDLMRRHHIRHLPVLRAGELVGIVSERDLELLELMPDVDTRVHTVEEAMAGTARWIRAAATIHLQPRHRRFAQFLRRNWASPRSLRARHAVAGVPSGPGRAMSVTTCALATCSVGCPGLAGSPRS